MKKIRILSIDGGGIRGILPGVILSYMEEQLQRKTGKEAKIGDYFDLIAGTSTGGILTCIYLSPDGNRKPKYSAKEALNIYLERGDKIFDVSLWQKIRSVGGLVDEKYPADELEKSLNEYFGDTLLSELIKPCLVTSYDIRNRKTIFFTSADATTDIKNFKVKDVTRATSAAPTYFEPALIRSLFDTPYALIDGGVFANNPAMCAYSEARTLAFSKILKDKEKADYPSIKDMLMVSIGTGSVVTPYPYEEMKNKGVIGWIKPLIDILMSGNSETVDYQLRQIYNTLEGKDKDDYYRIEPGLLNADPQMDNASKENLQALREAGLYYVSENSKILDAVVDKLIEHHSGDKPIEV